MAKGRYLARVHNEMENQDDVVDRLASRPYRRELTPNEDGSWFAKIAELPGCMTEGDTREEALSNLEDALRAWLSVQVEDGVQIPLPAASERYSGKFVTRVSESVHRQAAACASRDGVSLNAFVAMAISRAIGEAVVRVPAIQINGSFAVQSAITMTAGLHYADWVTPGLLEQIASTSAAPFVPTTKLDDAATGFTELKVIDQGTVEAEPPARQTLRRLPTPSDGGSSTTLA